MKDLRVQTLMNIKKSVQKIVAHNLFRAMSNKGLRVLYIMKCVLFTSRGNFYLEMSSYYYN